MWIKFSYYLCHGCGKIWSNVKTKCFIVFWDFMVYIVLNYYVITYSTKNVTEDNYLRMTQKRWKLGGSVWKKINQTGDEKIKKTIEKFAIIINKSVLACQYKFLVILYRLTGWLQKCIKTITIPRFRLICFVTMGKNKIANPPLSHCWVLPHWMTCHGGVGLTLYDCRFIWDFYLVIQFHIV